MFPCDRFGNHRLYSHQCSCVSSVVPTATKQAPSDSTMCLATPHPTSSGVCVHQAKCIVHGDVKPANFMLKQRFRDPLRALERGAPQGSWLKAVDFGCSQSYRSKTSLSRRTGTPVYMAPEVFKRDYLQASDMWSLGMMMYQLLTGRFPFWYVKLTALWCLHAVFQAASI